MSLTLSFGVIGSTQVRMIMMIVMVVIIVMKMLAKKNQISC